MNVFELFRIVTALATSTDVPVPDLLAIQNLGGKNEAAFQERIVEVRTAAVRALAQGDEVPLLYLWKAIGASDAALEEKVKALGPILARWDETRHKQEDEVHPEWIPFFEMIYESTDPELLRELKTLSLVPAEHAFHAMIDGDSEGVMRWYNQLPKENQQLYFLGLKTRNQLLRQLRKRINPDLIDPALLPEEPRIGLIKKYLQHPFAHQLQPFYGKTFSQLISWKFLTPEELFAHEEELIDAHARQGMAYFDLAQVYRMNERYDDALANIEKGLTRHVQNGNRLGCYLLEKTIILREAGRVDECVETFGSVPVSQLDRYNRDLHAKIEASLRDLRKE